MCYRRGESLRYNACPMTIFSNLTDRLGETFKKWSGAGRLSAAQIEEGLREIRIALIEADVNLNVATQFLERVREKATGTHILSSLDPAQMLVKVVRDELVELLGGKDAPPPDELKSAFNPILLLGLQGSGKTTSAAKLALHFKRKGVKTMLAALDMSRPAAIDQLEILGGEIDVPVFTAREMTPVDAAKAAVESARKDGYRVLIMDSAGRLHIDEELMREVREIKDATSPVETYLVVDAMTGQEAVNVAKTFDERVGVTGLIVTKFDGDARAGAALSVKSVTGRPIKFVGVGEKVDALETFVPDRMAGRILGMGDVLSLIEKAERELDEDEAERMSDSFTKGKFDVSDFLSALAQMQKLGPIKQVLAMLPGVKITDDMVDTGEEKLKVVRAIAQSMTKRERRKPDLLDASRKKRIAAGSGTKVEDVNAFLLQFEQMQQMMKMFGGGGRGLLGATRGGMSRPVSGPLGTMPILPGEMGGLSAGMGISKGGGKTKEEKAKLKAAKKTKQKQIKQQKKRKK